MVFPIRESIRISIKALLANKGRSFLTMLGIIIGVGAVVLIISLGSGAQSLILDQIKSTGSNLVGILPGKSESSGPPATAMGVVITTLVDDDMTAIEKLPHVVAAAGYSRSLATATWRDVSYEANIDGTSAGYLDTEGGEILQGRFFTADEDKNMARVVVLGATVKQELFGDSDAVGRQIKIKKQIFEVVGVMAKRGKVLFVDYDDQIHIPLHTTQKLISGVNYLSFIRVKVDNEANVTEVMSSVVALLRDRHEITDLTGTNDDFSVRSMAQALDMITTITNALRYFLIAMAAISLIVGGIGIMNIMLISVNERTREIGLRKAVGANNNNIISQFILEAISLTLIGGTIGVIFGIILSWLIYLVVNSLGYNYQLVITFSSVLLALSVSTLIGLIFGIYPARKASRLEPVEALSYE
ncbi:multidrug ABC transporter substrate-binding protein [Candidatus Falkowbacteria bacterium CG10_big_fil_rev_8_21_14_0_10_39_9]|uniref:Multidrug ABC transporter substrate-binding protein n=1 Tax=Candidatus Falkowbacteria bacterium CG10_big_fil_rev_8_21_14_0_10_39_9 TaxID=1974566 RepID=A0A2M6WNB4_9BACT|nr:MAG: multidrug ABC transporter substrate-binding protein [Candidatus Falkowbacteria bacterium CG10_big_fil_rev_8_21_14_0_10_39_9]